MTAWGARPYNTSRALTVDSNSRAHTAHVTIATSTPRQVQLPPSSVRAHVASPRSGYACAGQAPSGSWPSTDTRCTRRASPRCGCACASQDASVHWPSRDTQCRRKASPQCGCACASQDASVHWPSTDTRCTRRARNQVYHMMPSHGLFPRCAHGTTSREHAMAIGGAVKEWTTGLAFFFS